MTHMMLHVTSGKLHMNPTYFFHQTETLQDHIDTRNSNVLMIKNSGHCKLHDGHTNYQQVRNKLLVSLRLSNTFGKIDYVTLRGHILFKWYCLHSCHSFDSCWQDKNYFMTYTCSCIHLHAVACTFLTYLV